MYRSKDRITLDVLRACPDMLHKITLKANTNCKRVMQLVEDGLLEKRQVDSDGWSEKRKQVTIYHLTDEGRRFLDLYTSF